jgi:ribonuclease D
MTIPTSIEKDELERLPRAVYRGRIFVIDTEREAEKAVAYILTKKMVGIDSETRPSFHKGRLHRVARLQVATDDTCFLFRLNRIGFTPAIVRFLESNTVLKVGLSLKDDFFMLHRSDKTFRQKGCIELQEYINAFGIRDRSLQKIYAILFGEKISKSQRLTNWETDVLTEPQKEYAAMDAWACLQIYSLVEHLKQTGDYRFVPLASEKQA